MLKKALYFFLLLYGLSASAQKQAANWYFGDSAGLDFNSGPPVVKNDGGRNPWKN